MGPVDGREADRREELRTAFFTLEEVADTFDCSTTYVRQCIDERGLPAVKLGRTWYVHRDALLEWMKQGPGGGDGLVEDDVRVSVVDESLREEIGELREAVAALRAELRSSLEELAVGLQVAPGVEIDGDALAEFRRIAEAAREEARRARELLERREAAQEARLRRRDERMLDALREVLDERDEMHHAWWERWRRA